MCRHYRATLHALKCKNQLNKDSKTSHDSHTNYRYLQQGDVIERLRNVQTAKQTAKRAVERLKEQLNSVIEHDGVELDDDDAQDIEELITSTCTNKEVVKKHSKEDFNVFLGTAATLQ